ncbi:MAG TPA: ATP-grasp domain-containing protein [Candidatus Acidoferrum sp.]
MAAPATIPTLIEHSTSNAASASAIPGAVVMGADYRALGVVRSLGRRGIPVWVVKQGGHLVAAASRYAARTVPWPDRTDRGKIEFLLDVSAKCGLDGWLLVPTDDYTVGLASGHYEALARGYRVTVPPWESLRWACDKRLLHQLADNLGIHQPWTVSPLSKEHLAAIDCPFPVILKPAVRLRPSNLSMPKAWLAENRDSLLARYDQAGALLPREDLIVQEIVPGGGEAQFSYAALCSHGCSLASVVARRTRQFPKDFGQLSTYVETVDVPEIIEPAERLLSAVRFHGLAEVEFKRDPRDGRFKVLDINPRVWGWHTLCRRAGVDFPYLLWLLARGEPVPQLRGRAGERWVHLSADLRVAIEEIVAGRLSWRDYLRSIRGPLESALFSWDDPLPGLSDLPLWAYATSKRLLKSIMG